MKEILSPRGRAFRERAAQLLKQEGRQHRLRTRAAEPMARAPVFSAARPLVEVSRGWEELEV